MGLYATLCKSFLKHLSVYVMLIATLPLLTGCFGRFPLTRAVYDVNDGIGERFDADHTGQELIKSVVMWAFVIVPVYGGAMFLDALVFNLVEFWTGETIQIHTAQARNGLHYALDTTADGRTAILTVHRDQAQLAEVRFIKTGVGHFDVRDGEGRRIGQVRRKSNGRIELLDRSGTCIRELEAEALACL